VLAKYPGMKIVKSQVVSSRAKGRKWIFLLAPCKQITALFAHNDDMVGASRLSRRPAKPARYSHCVIDGVRGRFSDGGGQVELHRGVQPPIGPLLTPLTPS
jgi:hypothetical protein